MSDYFSATVDVAEVERALARMMKFGRDLRPLMRELRKPVARDQKAHALARSGPDGKWAPLSPFTIQKQQAASRKRGKRRSGKMLGKLPGAFRMYIDSRSLKLVSRVDWSGTHNNGSGGRVGRAPSIPARQYYWISDKLLSEIVELAEKYIATGWDR